MLHRLLLHVLLLVLLFLALRRLLCGVTQRLLTLTAPSSHHTLAAFALRIRRSSSFRSLGAE
jgi:hypothetical protein